MSNHNNECLCVECEEVFECDRDIQLCDDCLEKFNLDKLWKLHDENKLCACDFNENSKMREEFRK